MIVTKKAADNKIEVVPKFHMTPGLGFPFTPEDNYRMYLHCRAAVKFMETYGKGCESYEIDLSHYEKGISKSNSGSVSTESDADDAEVLSTAS